MRIYLKSGADRHLLFVTPGNEAPDVSDFMNEDKTPKQFTVRFIGGMATVPSHLGQYLVDKGMVQKSPPSVVRVPHRAQVIVPEQRVRNHRVLSGAAR